MVSNLAVALEVVFPIFCMILIGYLVKSTKIISRETFLEMNKLIFRLFLPVVIFKNILKANIVDTSIVGILIFCIIAIAIMVAISVIISKTFEKDIKKQSVMSLAMFRSNFALFGLPVVLSLYDNVGVTSIMIAVLIPLLNITGVGIIEYFKDRSTESKNVFIEVVKNPLVIAGFMGGFFLVFKLQLPVMVDDVVSTIASITTPLALMVLGGIFEFKKIKKNLKQISIVVLMRLFIFPLIVMFFALKLGYRGVELVSIMVLFGSPVAVSVSPMAMASDCDYELACQLIFISTLLAIVTVFSWVFWFQTMGWL